MRRKNIAIIGAGHVGLEAALHGARLGFEVDVFEKGDIGVNIKRWGHVTLFSPWELNHSQAGPAAIASNQPDWRAPSPSALMTGSEYAECYASRGPMKLSAALLGTSNSVDCLEQGSAGADTLKNPEPDFFIIGNKSYGRNSTFLINGGLAQIEEVFSLISNGASRELMAEAV